MKTESIITLAALAAAAFLIASGSKASQSRTTTKPAAPLSYGTFLGRSINVGGDPSTVYGWGLGLNGIVSNPGSAAADYYQVRL